MSKVGSYYIPPALKIKFFGSNLIESEMCARLQWRGWTVSARRFAEAEPAFFSRYWTLSIESEMNALVAGWRGSVLHALLHTNGVFQHNSGVANSNKYSNVGVYESGKVELANRRLKPSAR